jgi:hypothetical protein
MNPLSHFLSGLLFAGGIMLIFPKVTFVELIIFILSTMLIDADHYLFFLCKKKDANPIHAYQWYTHNNQKTRHLSRHEKKNIYYGFHFFHGLEVLFLVYLLYCLVSPFFLFVLLGFAIHLFADLIVEYAGCASLYKLSVFYSLAKGKRLRFVEQVIND